MVTRHESRHPKSTFPVETVLPQTGLRSPRLGGKQRFLPVQSAVKQPHPQIGDSARLWDYVKSECIAGKIEKIQSNYRILVRCAEGLEETFGWYLAFHEGEWVEEIVGVAEAKI
jgi:hypothetical protein